MTGTGSPGNLIKLGDTARTVADPDADVRGRKAVDSNGEDIGSVDDLLIDDEEAKVRFLRVGRAASSASGNSISWCLWTRSRRSSPSGSTSAGTARD